MKQASVLPYAILGFFLLVWTALSPDLSNKIRRLSAASFFPFYKHFAPISTPDLSSLQVENEYLKKQIELAREWIVAEKRWKEWGVSDPFFIKHRTDYLSRCITTECKGLPARVIYRDPTAWSSALWIRAGTYDNDQVQQTVFAKNSPVVVSGSLIGVIDYVGRRESRVRLITDSSLVPSVRVVRGSFQNRELWLLAKTLWERVDHRKDLFQPSELSLIKNTLDILNQKVETGQEDVYLAKGELHGSSAPFWRSRSPVLKGIGFNYDYADDQGVARDLRSGRPLKREGKPIPLVQPGDLLVTSGLDGVFPSGIPVAVVLSVDPLVEGAFSYELNARPVAMSLNDLNSVWVLPPLTEEVP